MKIEEFIEENNQNYKNMTFYYEYFTRDSFYSFSHIESCRRKKFITPTKQYTIKDGKCYIKCNEGKKTISFENFIKRDYPKGIEIILDTGKEQFTLDTFGNASKETDTWNYELYED